jgi:hypothetical protein
MMTAIPAPAKRTARGLIFPMRFATTDGKPKIPLPMMELTVSATRLQRPMARTSPDVPVGAVSIIAVLYHRSQISSPLVTYSAAPPPVATGCTALKPAPEAAFYNFNESRTFVQTKVIPRITKAHARGTSTRWLLPMRCWTGEILMAKEDQMDDLQLRIARVTEDLRTIQRELNCAAMQAPSDPELMESLNSQSQTEPIETLRSALDQMRHFLFFYSQVMENDPELGDKLRQGAPQKLASDEKPMTKRSFLDQLSRSDEAMLLHYLAESKQRKPN